MLYLWAHSVVDGTDQGEDLCCGQAVDGDLLEAGDDAGAGHGFTLGHPEHPLISQHQVTSHAYHHLTQLGDKKKKLGNFCDPKTLNYYMQQQLNGLNDLSGNTRCDYVQP